MPLARRKKPQILLAWHTYNAWADWNHTDNASDHRQWKERQRINHFYIELVAKHRQPRYFLYTFVANILKYSQRTHRHHAPKICCSAFLITWATLLFFILLPSLTLITTKTYHFFNSILWHIYCQPWSTACFLRYNFFHVQFLFVSQFVRYTYTHVRKLFAKWFP